MDGFPASPPEALAARSLLKLASEVPLLPPRDRAVFYTRESGARLAASFVARNPGFARLRETLLDSAEGRELWGALNRPALEPTATEAVWCELSRRLARAAQGTVNVFGPPGLEDDDDLAAHGHFVPAPAGTVFASVERPELETNPHVTRILFNGRPLG